MYAPLTPDFIMDPYELDHWPNGWKISHLQTTSNLASCKISSFWIQLCFIYSWETVLWPWYLTPRTKNKKHSSMYKLLWATTLTQLAQNQDSHLHAQLFCVVWESWVQLFLVIRKIFRVQDPVSLTFDSVSPQKQGFFQSTGPSYLPCCTKFHKLLITNHLVYWLTNMRKAVCTWLLWKRGIKMIAKQSFCKISNE